MRFIQFSTNYTYNVTYVVHCFIIILEFVITKPSDHNDDDNITSVIFIVLFVIAVVIIILLIIVIVYFVLKARKNSYAPTNA